MCFLSFFATYLDVGFVQLDGEFSRLLLHDVDVMEFGLEISGLLYKVEQNQDD